MENSNETLSGSITHNAIGLALFAFITAGVIGIVQLTSADRIAKNVADAQAKALYEITPKESVDNDVLLDTLDLTSEQSKKRFNVNLLGPLATGATAHYAKFNGETHTIIFPTVAPDGYTTQISLLVGVKLDGSLAGVRIIEHKETPGLGDKVELKKSDWVLGFNEKSLINPNEENWKVKKDGGEFDQFTGATITPRAVVAAVRRTLTFFNKHKDQLLSPAITAAQPAPQSNSKQENAQ